MERDSLVGRHPVRRLPRRLPARSGRALGRAALRRQPGLRRQLGSLLRVDRSRDRTPPADAAGHPSGRAPPRARTRRAAAPPRAHEARPQEHQGRHRHRLRRPGTARLLERARLLQVRRLVSRGSPPHGGAMPQVSSNAGPQHQLAVFIDFENIALGLQGSARFDTRRVLDRMLERGKVIVKVAYAEFGYYEDLERGAEEPDTSAKPAEEKQEKEEAFRLLAETVRALQRENFEVLQASLVKDTMKRKRPTFSEAALGYGSFSELLEEAQESGIVTLRKDERSGTYVVTGAAAQRRRARRRSHR